MGMTLKEFDKWRHRNFGNGAVLDEIAAVFKERDRLLAEIAEITLTYNEAAEQLKECDVIISQKEKLLDQVYKSEKKLGAEIERLRAEIKDGYDDNLMAKDEEIERLTFLLANANSEIERLSKLQDPGCGVSGFEPGLDSPTPHDKQPERWTDCEIDEP